MLFQRSTVELWAGLALVAAFVLAAQPVVQPMHMLVHHRVQADHAHADCSHDHPDHAHESELPWHRHADRVASAEPERDARPSRAARLESDAPGQHAPCVTCELLSVTSRAQALVEQPAALAMSSAALRVVDARTAPPSILQFTAHGRAPPVVVG